jgi:hypothetical protein
MAMANDMSALLKKIARRLGLLPVLDSLPEDCKIDKWANVIMQDTLVTFSRYYPYEFKMPVNEETCNKRKENGVLWYYIKDEILQGVKLLGMKDIDWTDLTNNNSSFTATSMGAGYFYPNFACPEATLETVLGLQLNANIGSLYNNQIYIDFKYPNKFALRGIANLNYDLNSFVVILLVEHSSLATISPTKMETFESLAQADVAGYLYEYLKYWDGLNTIFVDIDLKLDRLNDEKGKREDIINFLKESYVTMSNDTMRSTAVWTI